MSTLGDDFWKAFDGLPPPSPTTLEKTLAEVGLPVPPELMELYSRCNGGYMGRWLGFFTLPVLADVNGYMRESGPRRLYFASDGGDCFYFWDMDGGVGFGVGAVFLARRSSSTTDSFVLCAASMAEFMAAAAQGKDWQKAPTLGDLAEARMMQSLKGAKTIVRKPGAKDILATGRRVRIALPGTLWRLLEYSNGLQLGEVELYDTDRIQPVAGTRSVENYPGALWIGEDQRGHRYALSITGWREDQGEQVLCYAPDDKIDGGQWLGYLPDVIVRWVKQAEDEP